MKLLFLRFIVSLGRNFLSNLFALDLSHRSRLVVYLGVGIFYACNSVCCRSSFIFAGSGCIGKSCLLCFVSFCKSLLLFLLIRLLTLARFIIIGRVFVVRLKLIILLESLSILYYLNVSIFSYLSIAL